MAKIQEWNVSLSNGASLKGKGVLNGVGQGVDGDKTVLNINYKQGKTALVLTVTLPGQLFVTNAVTNIVYDAPEPTPGETPPLVLNSADAA